MGVDIFRQKPVDVAVFNSGCGPMEPNNSSPKDILLITAQESILFFILK
jgi:hypothetical protein